jgi:hypothetical protein
MQLLATPYMSVLDKSGLLTSYNALGLEASFSEPVSISSLVSLLLNFVGAWTKGNRYIGIYNLHES